MQSVFHYTNYREYLLDFYESKKAQNSQFSYQIWANKCGFKSKSFIKLVIDGKKNLSKESLLKLNTVLKLGKKSFSYLEDLVSFNQADTHALKNFYFKRLLEYNKRSHAHLVLKAHHAFYSQWYHNTVRELVAFVDFQGDYQKLGQCVQPTLSAKEARESVELLLALNLIKKHGNLYKQTNALVTTGNEVRSLAVRSFHLQNLELTARSIQTVPSTERDISTLVLGLSRTGFEQVKSEIQAFRKKILRIAEQDNAPNGVYHVNFQLFPTGREKS